MKLYHNPEYDKHRPEWQVARDLYEGDHETLSSYAYLWPHYIELTTASKSPLALQQAAELRKARAQRTRYFNFDEIVISIWTSIFFRGPPIVPDECKAVFNSPLEYTTIKNIDGYGKDLFKFTKDDIFTPFLTYGRVFVLANAPQGTPQTKAQEVAMGITPRLQSLCPLHITDWDIEHADGNRIGRLNMLRHEYEYTYPRPTETTEPKCALRSDAYRAGAPLTIFEYENETSDKSKVNSDLEWALLSTTPISKLTEIPIAYLIDRPWLRECNEEVLRYHNLRSNKDNIQHNQGADSGFIAGNEAQTTEEIQALCEYTWKFLKEGSTAFKLPPVDVSGYERALADSKATAFALGLNLLHVLPADSREAMSANSTKAAKENIYALVDSTLSDIELIVNQSIRYAAEFKGIKDFQEEVKFDRSIDEDSLTDFIALAQAFQDRFNKFPTAQKELLLKVAKKLDLSDEAMTEIEEGDFTAQEDKVMSASDVVNQAMGMNGNEARPPNSK